ncbi:MAG: hypothetical protein AAB650_01680 [Patescibacteria group bacterium]
MPKAPASVETLADKPTETYEQTKAAVSKELEEFQKKQAEEPKPPAGPSPHVIKKEDMQKPPPAGGGPAGEVPPLKLPPEKFPHTQAPEQYGVDPYREPQE